MNHCRQILPSLLAIALVSLAPPAAAQQGADEFDFERLAALLLERLDVRAGERVLLVAAPGRFDPLIPLLREGFDAAGAEDLGAWSVAGEAPAAWATDFTGAIAASGDEGLAGLLSGVDASIMLPGANPGHAVYAAIQDVLRAGSGRTIHFHWEGAYSLDGRLLAVDDEIDRFYQRVLLDTAYEQLTIRQARFERAMRGTTVRVTTPAGTDISFRIGDRPVNRQDGDASADRTAAGVILIDREIELPAGAIRVAPVESTVNGRIVFPPSQWQGQLVADLTLDFTDGVAQNISASSGLEAALSEIDAAGEAGRAFREFALGFNRRLAIPRDGEPWIPYYGYGAGVVRLSLGDNTELGGEVGGGYVRWNFFTDATVTVGGNEWVRDGRLVR